MIGKIKSRLDEYLEFDSGQLFSSKFNLVRVFGGSIRDSIADMDIHDVDIICGSKALSYVECILSENGYYFLDLLNGKDLQEMYKDIHVINEPHTWVKGKKIVQLIRPSGWQPTTNSVYNKPDNYIESFKRLISNVDISCCGVSYDGYELYEDYPNAIIHCQSKVFSINSKAWMYSERRCNNRKYKLFERGWKEADNTVDVNRDLKLKLLENG